MTKADLIMALSEFDGDAEVRFIVEGAECPFYVEEVQKGKDDNPVLTQSEAPTFEDICGMADACYEEWGSNLKDYELRALAEVSDKAKKAYETNLYKRYKG